MGFKLNLEAYPAKGFAAKFFDAVDKREEPEILVIDNYGIIDGITAPLGSFTGIGKSGVIRNSFIFVTDSLKEFESGKGGWEILILTSKNFQAAKSLALRQPSCGSDLMVTLEENRKFITEELNKSSWRYASGLYHVRPGSYLGITMCGFWGNRNLAFLHLIVTFEGEKNIGDSNILLAMNRIGGDWELLSKGNNIGIIQELTDNCKLVDAPSDTPSPDDLKILGPPDVVQSSRKSKPALKWEWSGDVSGIACYLIESEAQSNSQWFLTHFTLVPPQKSVEMTAPFGMGMQPHRWRVWMIDRAGAVVRSTWNTIIYTD